MLALRGGLKLGSLFSARAFVYVNVAAGLMYVFNLLGLDPLLPDPTLKFWQQPETRATKAILQFFCLALLWINGFMLYAMHLLLASPAGLLRFQVLGWATCLALNFYQTHKYGFESQFDTLGIQFTLLFLSIWFGWRG